MQEQKKCIISHFTGLVEARWQTHRRAEIGATMHYDN